MSFYLLKSIIEDEYGVPPFLIVNNQEVATNFYSKKVTNDSFYESKEFFQLKLVDMGEGRVMKLRDFHRWTLGKPNAHCFAVSAKFKLLLSDLKLPPHRFYEAQVFVENENRTYPYFIMHMLHDYLQEINYSRSSFEVRIYGGNESIQVLEPGFIKSFEDYLTVELRNEKGELDKMCYLNPKVVHFNRGVIYDFAIIEGQAIVSEEAKQVIKSTGITGVAMPKVQEVDIFKDLEIVMGEK